MALESSELLTQAIEKNILSGQIAALYQKLHAQKFKRRLQICSVMRRAAFTPHLAAFLISALSFGNLPRKILARATRPRFLTAGK